MIAAAVPAEGVDVRDVGLGDALEERELVVGDEVEGALGVGIVRLEQVLVVELRLLVVAGVRVRSAAIWGTLRLRRSCGLMNHLL